MQIKVWKELQAFDPTAVGSRVLNRDQFMLALGEQIENHDQSGDRAPGQHFVSCPRAMFELVSSGVGDATSNPDDYVLREWRGEVQAFLKREKASPVNFLACIVYTREAFLADPQAEAYAAEWLGDATHVLVAVLAGDVGPVQPGRFVANLAGGNNAFLTMTGDEIRNMAAECRAYWSTHSVVSD